MPESDRARIAVIGGGPCGAQCARRLAERGRDVTLFEPRRHWEKPCGGGMPARGFERFPFLDTARLPLRPLRRGLLVSPSDREAEVALRDPLFIFSRADLHSLLLDRAIEAGARLVPRRVVKIIRVGAAGRAVAPGADTAWRIRAAVEGGSEDHGPFDFIVAADGASGSTRRRLTGTIDGRCLTQGIGYFIPGLVEDRFTLKFFRGLQGYLWVFPRPDHSSAGICGPLGSPGAARLVELLDRFLVARYGRPRLAGAERYAALIPGALADGSGTTVAGPGWAAAGDRGRAVDPLTREGIYYAMLSGEMLADCLAEGRPESFPLLWRQAVADEFQRAFRLSSVFFDARFVETLVLLCRRSRTIEEIVSDLICGRQTYVGLRRRLLVAAPTILWEAVTARRGIRNTGRSGDDSDRADPSHPGRGSAGTATGPSRRDRDRMAGLADAC